MKKNITKITFLVIILLTIFSVNIQAAPLDTINVYLNKTTVNPNGEVNVEVDFGKEMGAYTVNFAYDNNVLEYVSSVGGTANDTGDKVIVTFYDATGGTNPRENMSVTFKAKAGIITSNSTDIAVTASGLSNPDGSETYDDITVPIDKSLTVEPVFVDYAIALNYTGNLVKEIDKSMALKTTSTLGKNYEHVRFIVEATKPEGATVQLIGRDSEDLEHDLIQNGWGDPDGFAIGGENVNLSLSLTGKFSMAGDYTLTFKLIDRDNSDTVIASQAFNLKVYSDEQPLTPSTPITPETSETPTTPEKLPSTGFNVYITSIIFVSLMFIGYIIYIRKKNK